MTFLAVTYDIIDKTKSVQEVNTFLAQNTPAFKKAESLQMLFRYIDATAVGVQGRSKIQNKVLYVKDEKLRIKLPNILEQIMTPSMMKRWIIEGMQSAKNQEEDKEEEEEEEVKPPARQQRRVTTKKPAPQVEDDDDEIQPVSRGKVQQRGQTAARTSVGRGAGRKQQLQVEEEDDFNMRESKTALRRKPQPMDDDDDEEEVKGPNTSQVDQMWSQMVANLNSKDFQRLFDQSKPIPKSMFIQKFHSRDDNEFELKKIGLVFDMLVGKVKAQNNKLTYQQLRELTAYTKKNKSVASYKAAVADEDEDDEPVQNVQAAAAAAKPRPR